jgi:hypothetical protein
MDRRDRVGCESAAAWRPTCHCASGLDVSPRSLEKGGQPTVVYDWDSLSYDYESIAIGGAAATYTAPPGLFDGWAPSVADALAFLDAYEAVRPLSPETRRAAEAHTVYSVAYTARCEHAVRGEPVTTARTVLGAFAERFL